MSTTPKLSVYFKMAKRCLTGHAFARKLTVMWSIADQGYVQTMKQIPSEEELRVSKRSLHALAPVVPATSNEVARCFSVLLCAGDSERQEESRRARFVPEAGWRASSPTRNNVQSRSDS